MKASYSLLRCGLPITTLVGLRCFFYIIFTHSTGRDRPSGRGLNAYIPFSKIKQSSFVFPRIPYGGNIIGFNINKIPKIENEEQKVALFLRREAYASNNHFLSFLYYWQILETYGTDPVDYVNKIQRDNYKLKILSNGYIQRLDLKSIKLGNFLYDEFRNGIAHIKTKSGRKKLELDSVNERGRIYTSIEILKTISDHYIRTHLKLNKTLYLVKKNKRGFPIYLDENE